MTDCTERHTAALACDLAGEGQKGMRKKAQHETPRTFHRLRLT